MSKFESKEEYEKWKAERISALEGKKCGEKRDSDGLEKQKETTNEESKHAAGVIDSAVANPSVKEKLHSTPPVETSDASKPTEE